MIHRVVAAILASALILLTQPLLAWAADTPAADPILRHIHKSFGTPKSYTLAIKDLEPSPISGLFAGKLTIGEGNRQQVQTIHISEDGRYYFISERFRLSPSGVLGFNAPAGEKGKKPALPIYITPDGKYMLNSWAQDASIDPDEENRRKIDLAGAPSRGLKTARVILVEYSDLQCPACRYLHSQLEKELFKEFEGKVRWVFKHYPLRRHSWAHTASVAVACANMLKPDTSSELLDAFFENQSTISSRSVRAKSLVFAKKAGIKAPAFEKCLDGKKAKQRVDSDISEGDKLKITGTPSIYINGRKIHSNRMQEIKDVIEEMLTAG